MDRVMNAFLWVLVVLLFMSAVGKLYWLGTGKLPARKPENEAFDVALNAALGCWALFLLLR